MKNIRKWMGRLTLVDFTFADDWWTHIKRGNFRSFITLASPLANTILNWKYLDWGLQIDSKNLEEL